MINKKLLTVGSGLAVAIGVAACNSDNLTNLNKNPNSPEDVPASTLFTNATQSGVGLWFGGYNYRATEFLIQAGLFFTIPLFLSVALGLSALDTGIRILPLSITLLIAAAGIPRFFPNASPRRVVQAGLLAYHYLKEAGLVPDRDLVYTFHEERPPTDRGDEAVVVDLVASGA